MRIQIGEHLFVDDNSWVLHGIYAGGGQVVAPVFNGWTFSPVAPVAIASFFEEGMLLRVRRYGNVRYEGTAALARMMSRVGEEIDSDNGGLCAWAVIGSAHCAPDAYVDLPCEIDDAEPGASLCPN